MEIIRNFSIAILIWFFGYCLFYIFKGFFKEIYKIYKQNMEFKKWKKEVMRQVSRKLKRQFKEIKK